MGERFGGKYGNPFFEGKIGGQNDRAFLVAVGDDIEEKLGPAGRQGNEAQFVEDEQIGDGLGLF